MSVYAVEVGSQPTAVGHYAQSIDAAVGLSLPTSADGVAHAGCMEVILSVEEQDARITLDGSTPTTTNGILLAAPGVLVIRGQATIAALKIIGVAAGGLMNYTFTFDALI